MKNSKLLETAYTLFQNGTFELALKYINQYIEEEDNNPISYTLRGIIKFHLGNVEDSINELISCTKKFPDYVDAYAQLGIIHERIDDFYKAYKYFHSASLIDSSNPNIFVCIGNTCCNLGLYKKGEENFLKAVALTLFVDKNDPIVQKAVASYNHVREAIKAEITMVDKMTDEEKCDFYLQQAIKLSKLENYENAIDSLNLVLAINSRNIDAYYRRGLAYQSLGKISEGISDFEKIIESECECDDTFTLADTYGRLALLYSEIEQLDKALDCFDKSLEIWPDNIASISNRGELLSKLGKFEDALLDYDKAIDMMPEWGPIYLGKAWGLMKTKRYEEALNVLDKATKLEPTLKVFDNFGECYYGLKDYNNALKNFIIAFAEDPSWSKPLIHIRKTAEALLHPNNPPLLFSIQKRPIALVIGNSTYKHLDDLTGQPINDALDIYSILGKFGFVKTIIHTDLTQEAFLKAIEDFKQEIKIYQADAAFLFYAGHGEEVNNQNYLLPIDCLQAKATEYGIKLSYILDSMSDAGVLMRMAFLDSCRTFGDGSDTSPSTTRGTPKPTSADGVRLSVQNPPNTHTFIAFATAFGQPAYQPKEKRNGNFTEALKNNLRKGEDVSTLFQNVRKQVKTLTKEQQIPECQFSMDEVFVF